MKLRLITDININSKETYKKEAFVECSTGLGNYLIDTKKAVVTGTFSLDNITKEHIKIKES